MPPNMINQCLDIVNSRTTLHLAIKIFAIILLVWIATYLGTPSNIQTTLRNISICFKPNQQQTIWVDMGPSTLAWYRALLITITSLAISIIIICIKGGKIYQDDLVFIAIVTIYIIYWWQQWWMIKETFMSGIGGGSSSDSSIIATGLSGEDWDNMAIGRTWTRDLSLPKNPATSLVAGINRPEHYDFSPDDMPLYQIEPDLTNLKPSIELNPDDLHTDFTAAGNGVKRRFKKLDKPLPDGRTQWHTNHINQQVKTVLNKNSRSIENKHYNGGLHGDFANHGWGKGRENMQNTDTIMKGLTPEMHKSWLDEYGYTYFGKGGDEVCQKQPRMGCGTDGLGRGECRNPHHCSNWPLPSQKQLRKMMQGGGEILQWP